MTEFLQVEKEKIVRNFIRNITRAPKKVFAIFFLNWQNLTKHGPQSRVWGEAREIGKMCMGATPPSQLRH